MQCEPRREGKDDRIAKKDDLIISQGGHEPASPYSALATHAALGEEPGSLTVFRTASNPDAPLYELRPRTVSILNQVPVDRALLRPREAEPPHRSDPGPEGDATATGRALRKPSGAECAPARYGVGPSTRER